MSIFKSSSPQFLFNFLVLSILDGKRSTSIFWFLSSLPRIRVLFLSRGTSMISYDRSSRSLYLRGLGCMQTALSISWIFGRTPLLFGDWAARAKDRMVIWGFGGFRLACCLRNAMPITNLVQRRIWKMILPFWWVVFDSIIRTKQYFLNYSVKIIV
jgi:hypothetical protein